MKFYSMLSWFSKMHSDFRSHIYSHTTRVHFFQSKRIYLDSIFPILVSTRFSWRRSSVFLLFSLSAPYRVHRLCYIVSLFFRFAALVLLMKCRFISFWVIWKWLAQIDTLFNLSHRWCLFIFMSTSLLLSSFPFSSYVSFMVLFHGLVVVCIFYSSSCFTPFPFWSFGLMFMSFFISTIIIYWHVLLLFASSMYLT